MISNKSIRILLTIFVVMVSTLSNGQEGEFCNNYTKGFFEFSKKHDGVIIYRKKDFQIEFNVNNGDWVVLKMNWISSCDYSFEYMSTNMTGLKDWIGETVTVKILSNDNEGYKYIANADFNNEIEFKGRINKLTKTLKKSDKKKIKKKLKEQNH